MESVSAKEDTIDGNKIDGEERNEEKGISQQMLYKIDDIPPFQITVVYSLQQVMAHLPGPLATVYIIHSALCTDEGRASQLFFAQLLSTSVFMMGVGSFLQSTFGVRLPIVQGSSFTFIAPVIAMMQTEKWKCPLTEIGEALNTTVTPIVDEQPWLPRMQEISGSLMVASVVQVVIGCTGIMGFLMNYIGPLTICPAIALVGLTLFETATNAAQHQWGIALLAAVLVIFFSMILGSIEIPLPVWKRKGGCLMEKFRIFKLYPHILSIMICWLLCYILTITNQFPDDSSELGYLARTDARLDVLDETEWFFFPYPCQWGLPTFSVGLFVGLVGATFASIIESVGDYYATAKASALPPPPKHAVNRGIAMEGFVSVISGLVGAAHATTSYSGAVGFIQITGVASRFVWQVMSIMFILFGVFGKFGAALVIIPDPIIGGLTIVTLAMVLCVGLSTLQYVNMNSSRNQLVLGVSLLMGLMLPFWIQKNPGIIKTGSSTFDQMLEVILSTGMFVGGILGFLLDNLIPGSKKDRGLIDFQAGHINNNDGKENITDHVEIRKTYDLPIVSNCLRKIRCCSIVPFLPSYNDFNGNDRKYQTKSVGNVNTAVANDDIVINTSL